MFRISRKNKLESGIIISIFIIVITLIVYFICNWLELGVFSIVIALVFSITSAWVSYYYSDKIVLASCKARPATKEEDLKLVNILDALMVTAGLPKKPDLYVVEDNQPNAFATGRNPEHSVICVTTGLLEKLDYYELEGVIAHEMSHIKNYDSMLILSHFKGHAMGGFGGALKNMSIGIASINGKAWIHSVGKTRDREQMWNYADDQNKEKVKFEDLDRDIQDIVNKLEDYSGSGEDSPSNYEPTYKT